MTSRLSGGLTVTELSPKAFIGLTEEQFGCGRPFFVCTVNPEIVELARDNAAYRDVLLSADVRTIDGVGVAIAVLRRGGHLPKRLTGVQITRTVTEWCRTTGRPLMIVGASNAVRCRAEQILRDAGVRVLPGLSPKVDAVGNSDQEIPPVPRETVVLVALGAPKQEYWIRRNIDPSHPTLFVGVGGAIDYLTGSVPLAPEAIRKIGLEWIYRLCNDPKGRFARQAHTLPRFAWREIVRPQ